MGFQFFFFFFSSRRRHTRLQGDWSSDVCSSDLGRRDGTRITVLDKLTYAGNRANLALVEADPEQAARLRFVEGDIADPVVVGSLVAPVTGGAAPRAVDAIVNFAAESHVDRSILDPEAFL